MEEELSERKKRILNAIVTAHIAYGEPVGSKTLAEAAGLDVSPATIRNDMADLEAMGYLEQPHTSAGRVPSVRGYRYYVDSLRERYEMTSMEIDRLNLSMREKLTELDEILAEASRLASDMTNYTGITLTPRTQKRVISRFETVYLDDRGFVLVMIFADGTVKTKNVRLAFHVDKEGIDRLTQILNQHFTGVTAEAMTIAKICEAEREIGYLSALVSPVAKIVYATLSEEDGGRVRFEGVNRLLQYPEYADTEKLRGMLGMIEDGKEQFLDLMEDGRDSGHDISVYIGQENAAEVMRDSTLVYRTIRRNGEVVGAIGVIGPCRMDYSKVIETLNRVAGGVDRIINDDNDGDKKE